MAETLQTEIIKPINVEVILEMMRVILTQPPDGGERDEAEMPHVDYTKNFPGESGDTPDKPPTGDTTREDRDNDRAQEGLMPENPEKIDWEKYYPRG